MSEIAVLIVTLIAGTALIRASGPVLLGGRKLPPRALSVVGLLAPALLAALVVIETFGEGSSLVLDERAIGVGAAGGLLAVRDSPLGAVFVAGAVTALARAI
ncbi:MAG: AzlD domain-containing protein [Solirubrobacterales bacterium]